MEETGTAPPGSGGSPYEGTVPAPENGADWLRRLAPPDTAQELTPASSPRTRAETEACLGPAPVVWAVATGHTMAETIAAEVPELGGGAEPFETLRMGTESSVLWALLLLADSAARTPAPDEALQGDRDFVRRGIPLDKVLRGIRLGHAGLAHALMAACRELTPPERRAEHMQHLSDTLFRFIDGFSSRMTEEYLAEHDRWLTGNAAARQETVRAILDGEPVDPDTAGQTLGYALAHDHLAITAWCDPTAGATGTDLQQAAVEFLHRNGRTATLVVPTGRTALWAWGSRVVTGRSDSGRSDGGLPGGLSGGLPGGDRSGAGRPAEEATAVRAGVHLACGSPHPGPAGFRQSHEESGRAARVARTNPQGSPPVLHYRDIEIAALIGGDLPAARNFVLGELGALADDTPQAGQLRETLRHYLQGERSLMTTAAHMHVARNTVTYRVKRAQQILGHDLTERHLEVHAALAVARALGPAVLRPAGTDPRPGRP
ncbi:hypothetical protein KNE206_51820 [Kitasatospora sp. NE20-6]|uniref:PucR family transcriptional regulator n=1 Tax=Kitasatospora sp. NE20-6 TaxID=2859066 RepID=UPI0034DBBB5F